MKVKKAISIISCTLILFLSGLVQAQTEGQSLSYTNVSKAESDGRTTYETWRISNNLPEHSEYEDPDGDDFVNFEEYALGLFPEIPDSARANYLILSSTGDSEFPISASITLKGSLPSDVFYQIMRSPDADIGNKYEDWEIVASKWKDRDWVVDRNFLLTDQTGTDERSISISVPTAYDQDDFKCIVVNTAIYPEFSWDHIQSWSSPRKPNINQDGFDEFLESDFEFIASMGITSGGLTEITIGDQVSDRNVLDKVLAYNSYHKNMSYINGAIVTTPNAAMHSDLANEDFALWDEILNSWALSSDRLFVDYRKTAGMQRQKDIVLTYKATGNHGIFVDAIRKTGGATTSIVSNVDKLDYLEKYYEFLRFLRSENPGRIRMINMNTPYNAQIPLYTGREFSNDFYLSDEAVFNAYFNSLYAEGWFSEDKDELASRMDWIIEKLTRHGKLFLTNGNDVIPSDMESVFYLGVLMTVMGENTFFQIFSDNAKLRYELGGWKNPTYWQHLADKKLGEPLSDAIKNGYVYEREFQFASVRIDLKARTAEIKWLNDDGTVKEVWPEEHAISSNTKLSAIIWPDKSGDIEGWMSDTLPQFSPDQTSYTIIIPNGTLSVPALQAIPQNINARVSQSRAVSLNGSPEERTTTFTVTAEDNYSTREYAVTFQLDMPETHLQENQGTPFFSELVTNVRSWMSFVEVANPGNVPIDLSDYLFLKSHLVDPDEALQELIPANPTVVDFNNRYQAYIPGYKFPKDSTSWKLNPSSLIPDPDADTLLEPGGVFVFCSAAYDRDTYIPPFQWPDKLWKTIDAPTLPNAEGITVFETFSMIKRSAEALYIFRILNDSVKDGQKAIGDPDDYEVVDIFADTVADGIWEVAGQAIEFNGRWALRRKPHIHRGVINTGEGLGTDPDNSEWLALAYPTDIASPDYFTDIGTHTMDDFTSFISTISSEVYLVSDGYTSPQSLQGDFISTTIRQFYENIEKADMLQGLTVISGSDGIIKDSSDFIVGNDTLIVLSADRKNVTKYVIINQPLDSDASLIVANNPSLLSISNDGPTGIITGIEYGSLLKDLLDSIVVPANAVLNIINKEGALLPVRFLNYEEIYMDTRIGDNVYFEVIAQDGTTKITYKLDPILHSSDAFVISNIYEVDQEALRIYSLPDTTGIELFFRNIEVIKGASARLLDNESSERTYGLVSYKDKLEVKSQDKLNTVIYEIDFLLEPEEIDNTAPVLTIAFSDTTIVAGNSIMVSAIATDDSLPNPPGILTYAWSILSGIAENVTISNSSQPAAEVIISEAGMYSLQITVNDGGMMSQKVITITVEAASETKTTATLEPGMMLYPNPATDNITIELQRNQQLATSVSVFNLTGKMVYQNTFSSNPIILKVSEFESGFYSLAIKTDKNIVIKKLFITR